MLAALKRCLFFHKPNSNLFMNFSGQSRIYWNCLYHGFIRGEREYGKRKEWVDYKYMNGHFFNHSLMFQRRRYCRNNIFIASILVGVVWNWQPFLNINNSLESYQSLTTQASSSEDPGELLNHILSKIEHSPHLASEISSSHIEKLCSENNMSAAMKLLQSLRDRDIFLNANAFNLLLVATGKGNDIRLVPQIFKDLLVSSQPISANAYLTLAKALKGINDDTYLLGFIKGISDLTFPSATVINRIIYAFDVCGEMDKALLIYDDMKSLECKPDLITYNTVLGILGRVGRGDDMLHEFALMKEAKVVPDIVSYNTLINTFRKLGRLDMCIEFLEEAKEIGLVLDLRTYTSLIDCFGHSGNFEESLRLFNEMKSKRIRPSIYIYRSLINNSKKLGKTELSLMFLEEMNASIHKLVGPKDFKRKKR